MGKNDTSPYFCKIQYKQMGECHLKNIKKYPKLLVNVTKDIFYIRSQLLITRYGHAYSLEQRAFRPS